MRALYWFWGVVFAAVAGGGVTLQVLGPPPHRPAIASVAPPRAPAAARRDPSSARSPSTAPATAPATATAEPATQPATQPATGPNPAVPAPALPAPALPTRTDPASTAGAPVAPPDPALLESAIYNAPAKLPRIAPDGRMPRHVYAAGFDPAEKRPRIAILLGGIGQSEAESDTATRTLPAAISFAVSPYTLRPDRLLGDIRARGHEMFVELPMEPQGYPVNDAGSFALLTGAPAEQNLQRLDWALSRIEGYVGATNALDGLRGERFSAATAPMEELLLQLAGRGLVYIDASPAFSRLPQGDLSGLPLRSVDLVVDEPAVRSEIDLKLAQLEQLARERGAALGLAGLPRPVTVERLQAWGDGLGARGFALVPVTQLLRRPVSRAAAGAAPAVRPNLLR